MKNNFVACLLVFSEPRLQAQLCTYCPSNTSHESSPHPNSLPQCCCLPTFFPDYTSELPRPFKVNEGGLDEIFLGLQFFHSAFSPVSHVSNTLCTDGNLTRLYYTRTWADWWNATERSSEFHNTSCRASTQTHAGDCRGVLSCRPGQKLKTSSVFWITFLPAFQKQKPKPKTQFYSWSTALAGKPALLIVQWKQISILLSDTNDASLFYNILTQIARSMRIPVEW